MYMSRVEIDFNNRMNIKKLSNLNAYHSWIEESFPDEIKNKIRSRKLWRIDQLNGKNYLLLVSEIKPDLNKLEKYGVEGTASSKDYDPFLNKLQNGDIARFKVVLNPTVSVKNQMDKSQRGKIIPLKASEFAKYLLDRSLKNGFSLSEDDFLITERKVVPFKHSNNSKKINLAQVTYEGKLKIADKEKMIETLISGIGKKKAYGFGLMTIILDK